MAGRWASCEVEILALAKMFVPACNHSETLASGRQAYPVWLIVRGRIGHTS